MKRHYIAPGKEKVAAEIAAEAARMPQMSPEAITRSMKSGMLKRWADEEAAGAPPGSGRA